MAPAFGMVVPCVLVYPCPVVTSDVQGIIKPSILVTMVAQSKVIPWSHLDSAITWPGKLLNKTVQDLF